MTGGTGTLGRAILRRAYDETWLARFTVFSRDPVKQLTLKRDFPDIRCVLGDIRDYDSLYRAMIGHDTVLHLAAMKHIPQAEANVQEAIAVNVTGSTNVAAAAMQAGVERVVGISTDKVCHPINVYGATKKLLEDVFREFNQYNLTKFHLCRYGNVIGSNGSVLQVWRQAIARGEKPRITDPEMTRFWLTEDQAVDLVLLSLQTEPGAVVIPLAPALSMGAFAKFLLGDIELEVMGLRPGEKLHECLITKEERHKVFIRDEGFAVLYDLKPGEGIKQDNFVNFQSYTSDMPVRWLTREELRQMAGLE
jgi:UDP-N-acetylglucosamine 4,6-dehydratase